MTTQSLKSQVLDRGFDFVAENEAYFIVFDCRYEDYRVYEQSGNDEQVYKLFPYVTEAADYAGIKY